MLHFNSYLQIISIMIFEDIHNGNVLAYFIVICHHSDNLQMDTRPMNTMSVTGQTLTLCCQAIGNPSPNYYEWCVPFELC